MSRIGELEREIAAEREAAARAEAETAQAIKTAEAERRRAGVLLGKTADAVERETGRALDRARQIAADGPVPSFELRLLARRILLGTAHPAPDDFEGPHVLVNKQDQAAAVIYAAVGPAQQVRQDAEAQLGCGHPVTARADAAERAAWSAYMARLRVLAGEAG